MAEPEGKALRAVTAGNAGPMTGPGTTTFLLGRGEVVAIDPGPDDPVHLSALLAALAGERLAAILVTHAHLDHSALAPRLAAATGAEVLAFGPAGSGQDARAAALAAAGIDGGEGVDRSFAPDRRLRGGDRLALAGLSLDVVATPGHTAEHLAFGWGETLFVGDHLMAWAPSLVSPPEGDMAAYMESLAVVEAGPWRRLRPAHGPAISDPAARIAEIRAHRRAREAQVLSALASGPADLPTLTARVYRDLTPALLPAAQRSALAQLVALIDDGRVEATPWPSPAAIFTLR